MRLYHVWCGTCQRRVLASPLPITWRFRSPLLSRFKMLLRSANAEWFGATADLWVYSSFKRDVLVG